MSDEPDIKISIRTEQTTRATLKERDVEAAVRSWMYGKTRDSGWLSAAVDIDCGCELLRGVTITMKQVKES